MKTNNEIAFGCYKTYLAIKQHFDQNSSYNFFKYNGKITAKLASFEKRKDMRIFKRISYMLNNDIDKFKSYFLSCVLSEKDRQLKYPAIYSNKASKEFYDKYQSFMQQIYYKFEIFLLEISNHNGKCGLLKFITEYQNDSTYLQNKIINGTWEDIILSSILDNIISFTDYYDDTNIVWNDYSYFIRNLDCLLHYNRNNIIKIYYDIIK